MISQETINNWLKEYATTTPEEAVSEWFGSYEDNLKDGSFESQLAGLKLAWGLYRSEQVPELMKPQLADALDKIIESIEE